MSEPIKIPEIPLETFAIPEDDKQSELGIKNDYTGSIDYGVIGSGQCGGRLAKSFYDLGYKKTIAMNTASSDLNPLDIPDEQKLKIGKEGSGKDMAKGEEATKDSYQAIFDRMKSVFGKVDKIIITVGFGGGTGAGGLCTIIAIAQKYLEFLGNKNPKTDVIVLSALPTAGELNSTFIKDNLKKIKNTMYGLSNKKALGPLLLIDNSRIEKLYKGIPPAQFWPTINNTITGLFQTFNYLSSQESGFTSFDAEDYKTLVSEPGLALLGVARVDLKVSKLSEALQSNIKKTLLAEDVDYTTATMAGCVIAADADTMNNQSMDDINYGFDTISNLIGDATVYRGLYQVDADAVRAYTFLSGMSERK